MDPAQQAAFRGANPGAAVTEADLLALCAGAVCALVIVWCAWVVLHAYKKLERRRVAARRGGGATRFAPCS